MTETPNGPDALEIFNFLRCNTEYFYDPGSKQARRIPWNWSKFLVNASNGQVVKYYKPFAEPSEMELEIEKLLNSDENT